MSFTNLFETTNQETKKAVNLKFAKFSTCDISNYISHFDGCDSISETVTKCNEWLQAKGYVQSQLFSLTEGKRRYLYKDGMVLFSFNEVEDKDFTITVYGMRKHIPACMLVEGFEMMNGDKVCKDMNIDLDCNVVLGCLLLQPMEMDERSNKNVIRSYHNAVIGNLSTGLIDTEEESNNPIAIALARKTNNYVVINHKKKQHATALTVVKNLVKFDNGWSVECIKAIPGFKSENGYMHGKFVLLEDLFDCLSVGYMEGDKIHLADIKGKKGYARLKNFTSAMLGKAKGFRTHDGRDNRINLLVINNIKKYSISSNTWFYKNALRDYKVIKDYHNILYCAKDYNILGHNVQDLFELQMDNPEEYQDIIFDMNDHRFQPGDTIASNGNSEDNFNWPRLYPGAIRSLVITRAEGVEEQNFDVRINMEGLDSLHDSDKLRKEMPVRDGDFDIAKVGSFVMKSTIATFDKEYGWAYDSFGQALPVHAVTGPGAIKTWGLVREEAEKNGLCERVIDEDGDEGWLVKVSINVEQPGSESRRNDKNAGINIAYFLMEMIYNPDSKFVKYLNDSIDKSQEVGMSILAAVSGNINADIDWIRVAMNHYNVNPWEKLEGTVSVDSLLDSNVNSDGYVFTHNKHGEKLVRPLIVPPAHVLRRFFTYVSHRDLSQLTDDFNVKCGLVGSEKGIRFMQKTNKFMAHLIAMANDSKNRMFIQEAEDVRREWMDEVITSRNINNWGKFSIPAINGTVNGIHHLPAHLCVVSGHLVEKYRKFNKKLYALIKRFPHIEPFLTYLEVITIEEYNQMAKQNGWFTIYDDPGSGGIYISDKLADILNFDSDGDRVFLFMLPSYDKDIIAEAETAIANNHIETNTVKYCWLWANGYLTKYEDLMSDGDKNLEDLMKLEMHTMTIEEFIEQCVSAVDNKINTARFTVFMIRMWEFLSEVIKEHVKNGGMMPATFTKLVQNALDGIKDACLNAYTTAQLSELFIETIVNPGEFSNPYSNITQLHNIGKAIGLSEKAISNDIDIVFKARKHYKDKLNEGLLTNVADFSGDVAKVCSGKNMNECFNLFDSLVGMKNRLNSEIWYQSVSAEHLRKLTSCLLPQEDMMPVTFIAECAYKAAEAMGITDKKLKFNRPAIVGGRRSYNNPITPATKNLAFVEGKSVFSQKNEKTVNMKYAEKIEYIYDDLTDEKLAFLMGAISNATAGNVRFNTQPEIRRNTGVILMASAYVNSPTPIHSWMFRIGSWLLKDTAHDNGNCWDVFSDYVNTEWEYIKEEKKAIEEQRVHNVQYFGTTIRIVANANDTVKSMPSKAWRWLRQLKDDKGRNITVTELVEYITELNNGKPELTQSYGW